jgi:predicted metal-binding membrane protein
MPMVLVFARVSRGRGERHGAGVPTWVFVVGYFLAWTAYGLLAYVVYRVAKELAPGFVAWDRGGRYVVAGALVFVGIYELTPLKEVCLRHCRGPLHFILHGWRDGPSGAVRMGFEHGLYCIGCCWGLMIALFALGVMSITWMVAVAAAIFAQKVLPRGESLRQVFTAIFVVAAIWVAAAPQSVPGLHVPGDSSPSMQMGR